MRREYLQTDYILAGGGMFLVKPRGLCVFLTCIFVVLQRVMDCRDNLDYHALMKEYYLLCGQDYFCHPGRESHRFNVTPSRGYRQLVVCPACSCDTDCIVRGDCCPDVFFRLPEMTCVTTTVIGSGGIRGSVNLKQMVNKCPPGTAEVPRRKCEEDTDILSRLVSFPVVGTEVPQTFYNKYCAECHGVTNFTTWNIDISCDLFADFNILSTLNEVVDEATAKKCTFQVFHTKEYMENDKKKCMYANRGIYTKCNETGHWFHYDPNIEYACESDFADTFRVFKNVFCYICNPSEDLRDATKPVSRCNLTGKWKTLDDGLERACQDLPGSQGTYPYKNIFCYLCNRGEIPDKHFVDIRGFVKEEVIYDTIFHYNYYLTVEGFDLDYFSHILKSTVAKVKNSDEIINTSFPGTTSESAINLTDLFVRESAFLGNITGTCEAREQLLPEEYRGKCRCDPACAFENPSQCCSDLALQLPTKCRDELEISNIAEFRRYQKGYLVINGCFQERYHSIYDIRCSRSKINDVFSILPIQSRVHTLSYSNLYCALCNLESGYYVQKLKGQIVKRSNMSTQTEQDDFVQMGIFSPIIDFSRKQSDYEPWNLEISCPTYLDFSHQLKVGELLQSAWNLKCRVLYRGGAERSPLCDASVTGDCGEVAGWTYANTDVAWACKHATTYPRLYSPIIPHEFDVSETFRTGHLDLYANPFCVLCRPQTDFVTGLIDSCNVTGQWPEYDQHDEKSCLTLPRVYYYHPFKNVYCVKCNGVIINTLTTDSPDEIIEPFLKIHEEHFLTIRNLFSIFQEKQSALSQTSKQCGRNQIFDYVMESCRNITCFSGRSLQNNDCRPLLQITKYLRYSMKFTTEVFINSPTTIPMVIDKTYNLLTNRKMGFAVKNVMFPYTALRTDMKCSANLSWPLAINVTVDMEVFAVDSVVRHDLEAELISLMAKTDAIYYGFGIAVKLSNLKTENRNLGVGCSRRYLQMIINLVYDPGMYFAMKVSNVLSCRQIAIHDFEYHASENMSKLTLTRLRHDVDIDEFDMTPTGEVRICYEYLNSLRYFGSAYPVSDSLSYSLWLTSLVCSGISLVSLFLGFTVYCLIPSLRTTPGKLIMLMMSSLFVTLLFLSLGYLAVKSDTGCVIVGMVSHFSWLSVFTSMQACNFHMFRVFTSKGGSKMQTSKHFMNKTLLLSLLYSYGSPVIVVVSNTTISLIVSQKSKFGYGGAKCFMDNTLTVICAFIVPVSIIFISNMVFFVCTVRAIHNIANPDGIQRHIDEVPIFIRLSTITGISWFLQIIDSFLPLSPYSFVATVINTLQGFFIFTAFIVNKRTLTLLKEKLKLDKHRQGTPTGAESNLTDISQSENSTKL